MTAAKFEILSGRTPMALGAKVVKMLAQGYRLHGNTWSAGDEPHIEFYQAVHKEPVVIKNE